MYLILKYILTSLTLIFPAYCITSNKSEQWQICRVKDCLGLTCDNSTLNNNDLNQFWFINSNSSVFKKRFEWWSETDGKVKAVGHRHANKKAQYFRFSFDSDFILFILSSFSWSNLTCFQWRVFLGAFECSCVCVYVGGGECVAQLEGQCVCGCNPSSSPENTHTHYLSLDLQCVCSDSINTPLW